MDESTGLAGLALSAFTSATILPGTSEAVLAGLLATGTSGVAAAVAVASLANVAGSVVNYAMGRHAADAAGRRWFPASAGALERARAHYARWGSWSLLFAWLPVIGDPITIAAGALGERFWRFLALVSLAKTGRYLAVATGLNAMM